MLFSEHCQIHILRLGDLLRNKLVGLDQFGLDLQRWMQLWALGSKLKESEMSTMLQDCPPVLEAYEEFKKFSSDEEMRERVRARERFLNDQRLKVAGARREERIAVAQNLKRLGASLAMIAEATGLSLAAIERLD